MGFEIGDLCVEPCSEPIVRLDLRSGSFKVGPVLPPLSTIETVGRRVLVFAAHQVTATGYMIGGYFVRTLTSPPSGWVLPRGSTSSEALEVTS